MLKTHPALAVALVSLAIAGCHRDQAVDDATAAGTPTEPVTEPAPVTTANALMVAGAGDDTYLTDSNGRALYVLQDDDGKRCAGDCLRVWQPLAGVTPVAGASAVRGPMISTISHDDGTMHVTYNGLPLYYFARDTAAGMTLGQNVEDAWGHWYLVRPSGELVGASVVLASSEHGAPPADDEAKSPRTY
jgi:predicted lipoprotein with Yx(FWY)xxD motif